MSNINLSLEEYEALIEAVNTARRVFSARIDTARNAIEKSAYTHTLASLIAIGRQLVKKDADAQAAGPLALTRLDGYEHVKNTFEPNPRTPVIAVDMPLDSDHVIYTVINASVQACLANGTSITALKRLAHG